MIGGTGGEGGEGKVGPGREGLMALASAGCEMPSSSYTAGPRPQLPGLWAAELASVASTQALQRDGWRDCEAGGSGRRGWARARNRLARSAGGCARARRARTWQAEQALGIYGEPPMSRWRSRFSAIISSVQSKEAPDRPCYGVCQTCYRSSAEIPWFLHGIRIFAIWSCGCESRD